MSMIIGTESGVIRIRTDGSVEPLGLEGRVINHVAAHGTAVLAAVAGDGLYRLHDGIEERLWAGDARSCAVSPDGVLYVGIEPAMILRSRDDGATWERLAAIDDLPTRDEWSFPPPPHEAHVLSIDFLPGKPDHVVAGIEVGGAIRSEDGGDTWEERNEGLYVDVHSLRPDSTPDRLYAVTGSGFYATEDGGRRWEKRMGGIRHGYTIGLAVHPQVTGDVFVAAGDRPPGVNARLYRSADGGQTWTELPEPPAGVRGRSPVPFFAGGAPHIGAEDGGVWRLEGNAWTEVARLAAAVTCAFADGVPSSVMH